MSIPSISTKVDTSYRQIIQLSAPIWLSILITQISFATNNYFLGHLGTSELAANGVGGIYYMILSMVVYGFANGVQIILSRRAGQEDNAGLGAVFSNAITLGLLLCLAVIAISLCIAPSLFHFQLKNADVSALAIQFILIRVWGLPFHFLGLMSNQLFISTRNAKYILAGIILSTIVNIGLDYALIQGRWGFAAMGISGAALASIVSEISIVVAATAIVLYKKLHVSFYLKLTTTLHKAMSIDALKLSSPVMIQYFFSIGTWMLFFIYVEHLGKDELAVSQVLRSVFGLVGAASWALASSCNTMVGNLLGQGKVEDIFMVIRKNVIVSLSLSLVMGSIYLLFPAQIFGIYTQDASLIAKALTPIKVVVVANFLLSISTVIFNAVLGTGNTRINMLIEFTAIIVYIIYIKIVIEQKHMSLAWAWGSEFVYWLSILIMALSYLRWGKWRAKIV